MSGVLGVDLGGTRLRAVLRGRGRTLRISRPRPEPDSLLKTLRQIIGSRKLDGLVIGARGVWTRNERSALTKQLSSLAIKIRVMPDIELAWHAALGGTPGVVVVAGTGAIAFARATTGRSARAGGLGPLIGDEGSAFWIGKKWLQTRPDAEQRRIAVRADRVRTIAALSKRALRERPGLAKEAAHHLSDITQRAALGSGLRGDVRVSWQGGLFAHKGLHRHFLKALPKNFITQAPLQSPVEAASKLLP